MAPEFLALTGGSRVQPVPMPASVERERRVSERIERVVREDGRGEVGPTAPGRWPALKRAREDLRMRRLAARNGCEQEAARQGAD